MPTLFRNEGLYRETEEAQNVDRVHYYMQKFGSLFHAITVESIGGAVSEWVNADKLIRQLFGKIAKTRWMSQERQASKIIDVVNCRAPVHLLPLVGDYFGGDSLIHSETAPPTDSTVIAWNKDPNFCM